MHLHHTTATHMHTCSLFSSMAWRIKHAHPCTCTCSAQTRTCSGRGACDARYSPVSTPVCVCVTCTRNNVRTGMRDRHVRHQHHWMMSCHVMCVHVGDVMGWDGMGWDGMGCAVLGCAVAASLLSLLLVPVCMCFVCFALCVVLTLCMYTP